MRNMETLRILWFNWRCIKNPAAGGAEVFTHEVAKRLVKKGHEVTLITSQPGNLPEKEEIEGYTVWRKGGKYSVYIKAKKIYEKHFRGNVDIIIDEINTLPFFTVKYAREPVIALIHQLAQEYWLYEMYPPISWIGFFLEPKYLKLYKDIPTITVSQSTKNDLKALGFKKIYIIPEGLSIKPLDKLPEKEKEPTMIFLGRFRKIKRPDHAVKAFIIVSKEMPDAKLWMIGDGPLKQKIEKMIKKHKMEQKITLYGKVSEEKKIKLLRRAHILIFPAVREGWGLVVTEANSQGTIAIGYDVPGLRDSIKHKQTGLLVSAGNIEALAKAIIDVLNDKKTLRKMMKNALEWVKRFNWNVTTEKFHEIIRNSTK